MEKVRIGDICDVLNGYAFKSDEYVEEGIRVIRIANVQKGYIEDNVPVFYPFNLQGLEKYMLEEGDLLMSLTGNVGRVAILEKDMLPAALNQRVACLRLKTDIIKKGFLFHILNSDFFEQQCVQSSNGVAQKNMSTEWLKNYEIPLYSIKEQLIITEILDGIRNIISLRNKEKIELESLIKARFVEMFGVPGIDEKGWGLQPLGECCELNPKKALDRRLVSGIEVSFVPMTAIYENGAINTSEKRFYGEVKVGFTYFAENDVLFAKITPCMENGKGAVAIGLCNGIGFGSTELHVLRPLIGKSNPYWLYSLTTFDTFRKDAAANMTGSAGQRRVPIVFLERYKVALPPIELQNQFADFVCAIDKSKIVVQNCYRL